MNPIWKVQLDLLEKFKQICNKYGLEYFALSGTLLGAVRHKGYIPWDDDIDVFLKWPDFKKLMEVAPSECEYPYFFQCIYTEEYNMSSACRLRRSDTTGFTEWELENTPPEYDKGIFIDIIPMFNLPDSPEERTPFREKVIYHWELVQGHLYVNLGRGRKIPEEEKQKYIDEYLDYVKNNPDTDVTKLKELYLEACAYPIEGKELGATSIKCFYRPLTWNREWFDGHVDLPFEDTTISCPVCYEEVLCRGFGDWRTPVKNASHHTMIAVDTERPWTEFDMSPFY